MVFHAQKALKLTYEHLRFQKFFRGLYPRTPVSRGASSNSAGRGACNARGGEGRRGEGGGRGEGGERINTCAPPGKNPMDAHESDTLYFIIVQSLAHGVVKRSELFKRASPTFRHTYGKPKVIQRSFFKT
jgi:hypothetical protein